MVQGLRYLSPLRYFGVIYGTIFLFTIDFFQGCLIVPWVFLYILLQLIEFYLWTDLDLFFK